MTDRSLRPMTLGDIFDEGFDLYKKNLPLFLLIAAVVAVPVKVIEAILAMAYVSDMQGILNSVFGRGDSLGWFFWFSDFARKASIPNICFYLAYTVAVCALAEAASQRYLGRSASLLKSYRVPLRRLPALIGASIVYLIGVSIGIMFCAVGVLVPLISWLFAAQAFVVESKGAMASLKRSSALVSSDTGRAFLAILLLGVLGLIIQIGFEYPIAYGFEVLLKLTPQTQDYLSNVLVGGLSWRDRVAGEVANALSSLLLMPFFISVLTVFYYDLRVRKEAFDVELLASDLGYPPLSELSGYLPAAMVFQSATPGMARPAYGGPPPPMYGAPPPPGYAPPQYGAPPPPGYAQPQYGAPPPPGYAPPQYGAPPPPGYAPPQYGAPPPPGYAPPQYGTPPPSYPPAGWPTPQPNMPPPPVQPPVPPAPAPVDPETPPDNGGGL